MAYSGVNISQCKLVPKTALVVYERGEPSDDDFVQQESDERPSFYVEAHSVQRMPDGRYQLGEGSPITYESVGRLSHAFNEQAANLAPVTGLLPGNLLAFHQSPGKLEMLWYDKPQMRNFLYSDGEVMFRAPGMLYWLRDGSLTVYATDAKDRPTAKTTVHNLPWANMSGGRVCLGNAEFRKSSPTYQQNVDEWTKAFWMSRFTMGAGSEEVQRIHELAAEDLPYPVAKLRKVASFARFTVEM